MSQDVLDVPQAVTNLFGVLLCGADVNLRRDGSLTAVAIFIEPSGKPQFEALVATDSSSEAKMRARLQYRAVETQAVMVGFVSEAWAVTEEVDPNLRSYVARGGRATDHPKRVEIVVVEVEIPDAVYTTQLPMLGTTGGKRFLPEKGDIQLVYLPPEQSLSPYKCTLPANWQTQGGSH